MNRLTAISLFAAGSLAIAVTGCSDTPMSAPNDSPVGVENVEGSGKFFAAPVGAEVVEDSYIVVFRDDVVSNSNQSFSKVAASVTTKYSDVKISGTYEHAFKGFSATIPANRLKDILADPRVAFVEPNQIARACSTSTFQTMCWGTSFIGGASSSTVSGNGSGSVSGVEVYVLDSGVDPNHPDLNVVGGVNFANDYVPESNFSDDNGHGTHVAGIIGAKDDGAWTVGVAPGVPIYGVKVLTAQGFGTTARILEGINWVIARKNANRSMPMVVNMSLAANGTISFDRAVKKLITAGITVVAAAGNSARLASYYSPARIPEVITVGAIGAGGYWATFSNYGSTVDILAPGVGILSSQVDGGVVSKNGTSMASPQVAGAAALYLSRNPAKTPAQVSAQLKADASSLGLSIPAGTTNKVVRVASY